MKYLSVIDKIYCINRISFFYMEIEATETDLTIKNVPECELWDIREFERYKVRLVNNGGKAEILDFGEWKSKHMSD